MCVAVILGNADQGRGECAERVRQRGPLRHRGHRHPHAHGQAQRRADQKSDDDPGVADDLEMHQRTDDGHHHAELGEVHAALCGLGMAQALEAQNEKDRGEQITEFDEVGLQVHLDRIRTTCGSGWAQR